MLSRQLKYGFARALWPHSTGHRKKGEWKSTARNEGKKHFDACSLEKSYVTKRALKAASTKQKQCYAIFENTENVFVRDGFSLNTTKHFCCPLLLYDSDRRGSRIIAMNEVEIWLCVRTRKFLAFGNFAAAKLFCVSCREHYRGESVGVCLWIVSSSLVKAFPFYFSRKILHKFFFFGLASSSLIHFQWHYLTHFA